MGQLRQRNACNKDDLAGETVHEVLFCSQIPELAHLGAYSAYALRMRSGKLFCVTTCVGEVQFSRITPDMEPIVEPASTTKKRAERFTNTEREELYVAVSRFILQRLDRDTQACNNWIKADGSTSWWFRVSHSSHRSGATPLDELVKAIAATLGLDPLAVKVDLVTGRRAREGWTYVITLTGAQTRRIKASVDADPRW